MIEGGGDVKEPFSRFFGLAEKELDHVKQIPVDAIVPSPYQPRTIFVDDRIDELCQTIRLHGVIQPIVVRKIAKGYELIAGERRLRACKKLEMVTIPAIVRDMNDSQAASAALIENLQREGLTAIEEAHAYQKLIELHSLTQESLAQRLGKGQSTVANKLRLLQLPPVVQQELLKRTISERHARALLSLKEESLQIQVINEILQRELNVKQTEERVKRLVENGEPSKKARRKSYSRDVRIAVNTIRQSIAMVKETGLNIALDEEEQMDCYEFVIRISK